MSTTLVTRRPCGCFVLLVVNEPDTVKWAAKDIMREIREGRVPVEMQTDDVRKGSWHCADHPKGWRKGKPVVVVATAGLWEDPVR